MVTISFPTIVPSARKVQHYEVLMRIEVDEKAKMFKLLVGVKWYTTLVHYVEGVLGSLPLNTQLPGYLFNNKYYLGPREINLDTVFFNPSSGTLEKANQLAEPEEYSF